MCRSLGGRFSSLTFSHSGHITTAGRAAVEMAGSFQKFCFTSDVSSIQKRKSKKSFQHQTINDRKSSFHKKDFYQQTRSIHHTTSIDNHSIKNIFYFPLLGSWQVCANHVKFLNLGNSSRPCLVFLAFLTANIRPIVTLLFSQQKSNTLVPCQTNGGRAYEKIALAEMLLKMLSLFRDE